MFCDKQHLATPLLQGKKNNKVTATALLQCNKAQLSIYLVGRAGLGRTGCAVDADDSPRPGMDGSKREREREREMST